MSRIYVKNLPKNVTEDILRKHFGKIGQINDVNLKYKDGTFRGFCFIGFETEELAQQACEQFNNSFIRKQKISVEIAKTFAGTAATKQCDGKQRFEYRIENWNLSHKVRLWMNKGKNNQHGLRKPMIIEFLKPLVPNNIFIPRKMKFIAYLSFENEKEMKQAIEKDNCFMNGNKIKMTPVIDGEATEHSKVPWQQAEDSQKLFKPVSETAKIYVRNLSYTVTESDLREFFGKIGPIRGLSLPICKLTSKPKGFAHIAFLLPEHAVKALNLDGSDLKGRVMHIMPSNIPEEEEIENEPFQKKRDTEKKAKASSWHNWNTLFMSSDAVMHILAKENATTKLQMLEQDDPNLAVKMALQETEIVNETKKFLEENGVCLDAFTNPAMERSNNIILAKNLPTNTTADELHERFIKFGDINRLLLPDYGLTAIIEFVHEDHASIAFKKSAYRQFKNLPLYLEWAPVEIFKEVKVKDKTAKSKRKLAEQNDEETSPSEEVGTELEKVPDANATIYVKNINFTTTEEILKDFFSSCGDVYSAVIAKKNGLSQGYGFVQYYRTKHAKEAHLKFQDVSLEDHQLIVERSQKMVGHDINSRQTLLSRLEKNEEKSTKIIVKNLPFNATVKEIKDIFKPFGSMRTLRLPMKFDGSGHHRGFAFVDFSTIEDAERAMSNLMHSTHMYGRRLVLKWAKADESVEEVMKRTAEAFMASGPDKKKFKPDSGEDKYNLDML